MVSATRGGCPRCSDRVFRIQPSALSLAISQKARSCRATCRNASRSASAFCRARRLSPVVVEQGFQPPGQRLDFWTRIGLHPLALGALGVLHLIAHYR